MCREILLFVVCCVLTSIWGQTNMPFTKVEPETIRNKLSTRIGNFSLEILYHTSEALRGENLVISPLTVWTMLAVIAEGASGRTLLQIQNATRIPSDMIRMRNSYINLRNYLIVNTSTIQLEQVNAIFADETKLLERDYVQLIGSVYSTRIQNVNFAESTKTANLINQFVQQATHGRIPSIVDESSISDSKMLLASALYFRGQWTAPFNVSSTQKQAFFDAKERKIGEVNMMYNRYMYPFAHIREIHARVLELPYGVENRLSMLIMLPNPQVTLEDMFLYFQTTQLSFAKVFTELQVSREEYGDDEVDCFIPRFKIESSLRLDSALMAMGVNDLFDAKYARLPKIARNSLYVTKVIHKAEIEVTEEGTTASAVSAAEFANRIGVVRFEANRPFAYMIVDKLTNSIVFGGLYQQPSLY